MSSTFRFVWDGNVLLHETFKKDNSENTELTTWVFEEFVPTAKLVNGKAYSIISDHLGTPILAIDSDGMEVWIRQLDIYGRVRKEYKHSSLGDEVFPFVPFLYQGQYYDFETNLAYNRYRYYSPETGTYISQDPIGLEGNNPNIYAYVEDSNWWLDIFGLACSSAQMANNRKNGKKAEDFIHDRLLNNPDIEIIGRNVTVFFDKKDGGGVRYIDILARNKKTGKIINVEVKSGKAKRSKKQIKKDTLINKGQGTFGEKGFINKNDPLIGQKTNNTTTSVTQVELWKL